MNAAPAVRAAAADARQTVAVLGSTGSIGTQTLEVVAEHPERFVVTGLAAGGNAELAMSQVRATGARLLALADPEAAARARRELGATVEIVSGPEGVAAVASSGADVVVNGLVGSLGLGPTLAALQAGSRLALANKESLIVGGELVLDAAADGQIVPVDSEHSALAQCLRAGGGAEIARLVVTASGGPFRGRTRAELEHVTVAETLDHPTWDMGAVITVNSASLANKGLEVIEAHLLFGIDYDRIEVVVHPQSVVHGMVEFIDGATIAKLSPPDMKLPIQLALGWPERLDHAPTRMDWTKAVALEFEPVDADTFPMLSLAVAAGRRGGTYPGVLNAANEVAVAAFLHGALPFTGIPAVVEAVLEEHDPPAALDLATLLDAEDRARRRGRDMILQRHA
jgi:1-deoxy-D-xylulose-5-phosphate reductoisomerase